MSLEWATALGLRAGDRDNDKFLSGKFFSSTLEWFKMIVFVSRDAEWFFFCVPFHHLDVNNTTRLPLLMLQWTSGRGSWPYWEMHGWMLGKEIAGILLAHTCAAVNKEIAG